MSVNISGVILSGGTSRRFIGIVKSNLQVDGVPIISRITGVINKIFDEIIIVTNTPEEFKDYSMFKIVSDQFKNAGPLGGIHAAIKSSSKKAVFVFAGDMPFLDKSIILEQIEYYNAGKCEALIPRLGDRIEPLHAIYSNKILEKLGNYLTDKKSLAVRDLLTELHTEYMPLMSTPETIRAFININTPTDLKKTENEI